MTHTKYIMKLLRLVTIPGSFGLLKGQLEFLSNNNIEVVGVSGMPQERLRIVEQQEKIRCVLVPDLVRPISPWKDIKALFTLIKVIKKENPDIVHCNTPKASLLGMIAAWICRVPHRIYTVTGLRFETTTGLFRWTLITMERITCACATKVIPEGDGVAKTLRRESITKKPLKKILNGSIKGIDLDFFRRDDETTQQAIDIRQQYNIPSDAFVFIFVGRLVRDKGIVELVEAFSKVSTEYSQAYLFLVGPYEVDLDPLPNNILDEIKRNSNIIETGFIRGVRPYFAAADALVFPSYREGFPNAVLEAGAMGLPSIVTDINGCNEIIVEGENGTIIPTHNAIALEQSMRRFLCDKEILQRMSKKARPMIESRYERSMVWEALLQTYNEITKISH